MFGKFEFILYSKESLKPTQIEFYFINLKAVIDMTTEKKFL